MKVIIAGGRDFTEINGFIRKCDSILSQLPREKVTIVSGMAKGADTLAVAYAKARGYRLKKFPANWEKYGKKAGWVRNTKMADYADALIAFWDGQSSGTKMMIDIAQEKELKIRVIKYKMVDYYDN